MEESADFSKVKTVRDLLILKYPNFCSVELPLMPNIAEDRIEAINKIKSGLEESYLNCGTIESNGKKVLVIRDTSTIDLPLPGSLIDIYTKYELKNKGKNACEVVANELFQKGLATGIVRTVDGSREVKKDRIPMMRTSYSHHVMAIDQLGDLCLAIDFTAWHNLRSIVGIDSDILIIYSEEMCSLLENLEHVYNKRHEVSTPYSVHCSSLRNSPLNNLVALETRAKILKAASLSS